jgi:Flp pilus assembly protein TadG
MYRRRASLGADERGGAILEFAILAPVLFTILFGFIEMGRMFYIRQSLEYATEEAARFYMLNPTTDTDTVKTTLRNAMAGGMGPSVTVTYLDTPSCNGNAAVTCTLITATYAFAPAAGFLPFGAQNLTAKAQAVRY